MTPKLSSELNVASFRQIVIWPLLLKSLPAEDTSGATAVQQFQRWLDLLTGESQPWKQAVTLPATPPPAFTANEITYEEVVYFHPFVRDFLYGDGSDEPGERSLVRLVRRDVKSAAVQLTDGGEELTFSVDRVELYLCKPLVALLVVEVASTAAMKLDVAMAVQNTFRQVFPPFWDDKGNPGNCPSRVEWRGEEDRVLVKSDYTNGRDGFAKFAHRGAEPPACEHWQWLLTPLQPFPGNLPNQSGHFYQQIMDDRLPGMTFLVVDNPRDISEGDWDRLTWVDTAGADSHPYAPTFLAKRREAHRYERFWEPSADRTETEYTTRYLCSGYQYVAVGTGGFFSFVLQDHFHRHYFRIALILFFHRAALLKFQDEMAEAIKLLKNQGPDEEFANPKFRRRVTYLQMTFLKFRTRSWFTEVSNQLQGRELFEWWSGLLGNAKLFDQVEQTSRQLYEALGEHETRSLSKAAFIGLPVSLVLSFLSVLFAAFAITKDSFHESGMTAFWWAIAAGVFGLGFFFYLFTARGGAAWREIKKVWRESHNRRD